MERIGKATRGEWRPVRGWSLKVRGTGLIGLGCRRERKRKGESGGVGLGSRGGIAPGGRALSVSLSAAHARCTRRLPGVSSLSAA